MEGGNKTLSLKCSKSCCFRKKLIFVVLFATLRAVGHCHRSIDGIYETFLSIPAQLADVLEASELPRLQRVRGTI